MLDKFNPFGAVHLVTNLLAALQPVNLLPNALCPFNKTCNLKKKKKKKKKISVL